MMMMVRGGIQVITKANRIQYKRCFSQQASSLEFKHPKAQELFHKMTQLQRDELKIISDLINQKIGITITQADKLGRGGGGSGSGSGGGSNNNNDTDSADNEAIMKPKTHFDLKLISFDAKAKIKVIKEIRAITGLGLKEAKDLVEGVPKVVKKDIKVEEAEALQKILEDIGAVIELD